MNPRAPAHSADKDLHSKPSAGLDAPNRTRAGNIAGWVTIVVLAVLAVWLDFRIDDISISLFAVLAAALLVGGIWRERAWRWGLVLGAALPAAHLVRDTFVLGRPLAASVVLVAAFIPSFVGAYLGAFFNKMVRALFGAEDTGT